MEPLSATASIFAVLSLAIQLGNGAQDLVKFLGTISDAPEEVKRLRDLLSLVHALAAGVRNALEGQRSLYGDGIPVEDTICESLRSCQRMLSRIQEVLNRVDDVGSGRTLFSRSWARLKLSLKKEDIAEFDKQLDQAIQRLNVALTVNMMMANTRNTTLLVDRLHCVTTTIGALETTLSASTYHRAKALQEPTIQQRHVTNQDSADFDKAPLISTSHVYDAPRMKKQTVTYSVIKSDNHWNVPMLGLLKTATSRKLAHDDDDPDFKTETITARYTIRPSFLSWSLQLSMTRSGCTIPSMSLQVEYPMSGKTWEKVWDCAWDDDIQGFKQMLSSGEINFATSSCSGVYGLMGAIPGIQQSSIVCRWLLEHSYVPRLSDVRKMFLVMDMKYGNPASVYIPHWIDTFKIAFSRLVDREFLLVDDFFVYDWELWDEPQYAIDVLKYLSSDGLSQTLLPKGQYLGSIVCLLAYSWSPHLSQSLLESQRESRDDLARRLIVSGADLHYINKRTDKTTLGILLSLVPEKDETASGWLELLTGCGVDVTDYLQREHTAGLIPTPLDMHNPVICKQWWYYYHFNFRKLDRVVDSAGRPSITVSRWVDTAGPAAQLLQEFDFGTDIILNSREGGYCHCCNREERVVDSSSDDDTSEASNCTTATNVIDYEECVVDWSSNDGSSDSSSGTHAPNTIDYDELWPLHLGIHTMCDTGSFKDMGCIVERWQWCCEHHLCQFNHERFARKQEKKAAKRLRALGIGFTGAVMPGMWVE